MRCCVITVLIIVILGGVGTFFGVRALKERDARNQLVNVPRSEREITIIEGWNLRDIADYFVKEGIATSTANVYALTGTSAKLKNTSKDWSGEYPFLLAKADGLSLEGFLFPDTYRIYTDSSLEDVIKKLLDNFGVKLSDSLKSDIKKQNLTINEVLTIASILESEVPGSADRAIVSGILQKRLKNNWPLQMDSTVNYATGADRSSATAKDLQSTSPWNTYKYRGLPPGPIGNPGMDAVQAAVYPKDTPYWFFLTGTDGKVYYAKTLEEQTKNKYKYLKK